MAVGRLQAADQLAHDHGQLALEVDPAHPFGAHDRVAGADHRGRRLEEQHRLGRDLVAELAGVLGVVAADGHHLARQHRGQQPDLGDREPLAGVLEGAERVGADGGHGLVLVDAEADVALMAVADDAHGSGLEEEGFEGQPGAEGEGDDPLAGLDLAAGQELLEDEQDGGR